MRDLREGLDAVILTSHHSLEALRTRSAGALAQSSTGCFPDPLPRALIVDPTKLAAHDVRQIAGNTVAVLVTAKENVLRLRLLLLLVHVSIDVKVSIAIEAGGLESEILEDLKKGGRCGVGVECREIED